MVLIKKGDVVRLASPPTVKVGDWCYGANCHSCSAFNHVATDDTQGEIAHPLVGEGHISFACRHCSFDGLYETSMVFAAKMTEPYTSYKDLRPNATGGSRVPLNPQYKKAKITWGVGSLERRPECAVVVSRIVSYWTYVETQSARLLARLMKTNDETALAVYLSIRQARQKRDALNAAADISLSPRDRELLAALLRWAASTESKRNDIAHGVFGFSESIPSGLAWTSTTNFAAYGARLIAFGSSSVELEQFQKGVFVYQIGHLETVAREIEELELNIRFFSGYLTATDEGWRDQRYLQLCAEPRIAQELDRLRAAQSKQ